MEPMTKERLEELKHWRNSPAHPDFSIVDYFGQLASNLDEMIDAIESMLGATEKKHNCDRCHDSGWVEIHVNKPGIYGELKCACPHCPQGKLAGFASEGKKKVT